MEFVIGLVSFFVGALFFAAAQVKTEKEAVKNGFIKIDGKYYLITPMNIGGKKDD